MTSESNFEVLKDCQIAARSEDRVDNWYLSLVRQVFVVAAICILGMNADPYQSSRQARVQTIEGLPVSPRLKAYVKKVEQETARVAVFERRVSTDLGSTVASFEDDLKYLWIGLAPNIDLTSIEAEAAIAHEVTHGRLYYAKGYDQFYPAKAPFSEKERQHLAVLTTMLHDIPVTKVVRAIERRIQLSVTTPRVQNRTPSKVIAYSIEAAQVFWLKMVSTNVQSRNRTKA